MAQTFCGTKGVGQEIVGEETLYFHTLPNGQPAYPQRYKKAEPYEGRFDLAWVQKNDGTWVKIDRQGREVKMKDTQTPL